MKGSEIRNSFLKYFESKGHTIVGSSSLVPHDDPTILFSNAGMNQFKGCFLGSEKRSYTRATTSQKCMRISGKHNDFENVGVTARHHTFFEMLGNFSFGDYFKEDAIKFAWEFITQVLKFPPSRLWVSIFENDDEAGEIWQRVAGVDKSRIVKLGEKDNFWAMGDTGPCGPCSEIYYFLGEDEKDQSLENFLKDDGTYLEFWNLVFMQFNRQSDGTLQPLPKPSVDTGMGLERVASIIQKKPGNYETDLVFDVITVCEKLSGYKYTPGTYGLGDLKNDVDYARNVAMRVIADHSRSAAFLIADGVVPTSDGRGYILRRLLRRAIRHGKVLNFKEPFLTKTTARVIETFKNDYPELAAAREVISRVVSAEESKFHETLDAGLSVLQKEVEKLKEGELFPGKTAFLLHDTYGFPLDLTEDALKTYAMKVDTAAYEKAMHAQKSRSRDERKSKDISFTTLNITGEGTKFSGYQNLTAESKLVQVIEKTAGGYNLIFEETPFYAESGGQVGDIGSIKFKDVTLNVFDTQKVQGKYFVHDCEIAQGNFSNKLVGSKALLEVNQENRRKITANHSATHLIHSALKEILGKHVKQAGSQVNASSLRFDYSHFETVNSEQLSEIERWVNSYLRSNHSVNIESMSIDAAKKKGATALFGEKYGDVVRVVEIGPQSMELCGGCHVKATGELGFILINYEGSVSAGVRRIECLSGEGTETAIQKQKQNIAALANQLKCDNDSVLDRFEKTLDRIKQLEKDLGIARLDSARSSLEQLFNTVRSSPSGVKVLISEIESTEPGLLKQLVDEARVKLGSGIVAIGCKQGDSGFIVTGITSDLAGRFNAGDLIKQMTKQVGGKGGGKADFAQAGGVNPDKISGALEHLFSLVG